jgi:uracil-DNA glycosylase
MAFVFYGDDMNWEMFLEAESKKDYYKPLMDFVENEYNNYECFAAKENIFNAYKTAYDDVRCVILGQDPYINPGEAHGYAFSVYDHHLTPSLRNIYKEMSSDLGCDVSLDGDISYLSGDGVMLLNTILTVRSGESMSHKGHGWEILTDNTIKALNDREKPIVFILWGNHARKKKELITNKRHLIIESSHPSPLGASKGFFGSKPFSKCNSFLIQNGMKPINWIKNKRDLFNI